MQEQDIPIDIHTNKLLDWLMSRRICTQDCLTAIVSIREKINNAIQDMPVHPGITKLVSGSYINYFHCKKIIEILKETEASSKNFFGSYGSQRMKDWTEIVRDYEKKNTYLAEAAQMLIRNVNFEVPGLKKEIAHCETTLLDCDKKIADQIKTANTARGEFDTLRKNLGIEGKNIKRELVERLTELPKIYAEIAKLCKTLDKGIEFYSAFVSFMYSKQDGAKCLPILRYVAEKGNTTTFEWKTGKVPTQINEPALQIDFDDQDEGEAEINFDIDVDIDYGITADDGGDAIDWGDGGGDSNTIQVVSVEESVADGQNAFSILDNPACRDLFIDDLKELSSFLCVRLLEMKDTNDVLTLAQMQNAPTLVQVQTIESVQEMLSAVLCVVKKFDDPITEHLHKVKHSPRYVDILTTDFKRKLAVMEKMAHLQVDMKAKQAQMAEKIQELKPRLKLIIEKTKGLQKEIEDDISKKYKNRVVNIMGGVNVM